MTLFQKIHLSGRFGKTVYVISGIISLMACALTVYEPGSFAVCFLLKLFSIPVILYLYALLKKNMTIYFYINLGISRKEYYLIPVVLEFIVFVILLIASTAIGYAIH